jgi:hypothetical protein
MRRAVAAGATYFLLVFVLGIVLGTVRTLLVEPRLGLAAATALELPVMLAASWFACTWVIARLLVPPAVEARLAMGGLAFALLMAGELAVSVILAGRTPAEHLATFSEPARQWGLAAQLLFALFPALQATPSASSA